MISSRIGRGGSTNTRRQLGHYYFTWPVPQLRNLHSNYYSCYCGHCRKYHCPSYNNSTNNRKNHLLQTTTNSRNNGVHHGIDIISSSSIPPASHRRHFHDFLLKSRLGPRAPKFIDRGPQKPRDSPSIEEVRYRTTRQLKDWKFWREWRGVEGSLVTGGEASVGAADLETGPNATADASEGYSISSPSRQQQDSSLQTPAAAAEEEEASSPMPSKEAADAPISQQQRIYNTNKTLTQEFLAKMQQEFDIKEPDVSRVFGLPQFIITALRNFDASPIQTDSFTSPAKQKKFFSEFYKDGVVLPFHERDEFFLPEFFGASHKDLDCTERKSWRRKYQQQENESDEDASSHQVSSPLPSAYSVSYHKEAIPVNLPTEEKAATQDSQSLEQLFYLDHKKRLETFKARTPLNVRVILDRFGTGKLYETMKHGTEDFTIICGSTSTYPGSLQQFVEDRTMGSWMDVLRQMPTDAHRNLHVEKSIAVHLLSRYIHLYFFDRKYRSAVPYDYLTSQYGLGSYCKRILYESCFDGLDMVPYHTIVAMINEIIHNLRRENRSTSLVLQGCHEFAQLYKNSLLTRDGRRANLLVKMMEVITDIDLENLYLVGSDADVTQIEHILQYGTKRSSHLSVDPNQPLIENAKEMLQEYVDLSDCPIVHGDLVPQSEGEGPCILVKKQTEDQPSTNQVHPDNTSFLFALRRCRPWLTAAIMTDLSQCGILAPKPNKNIFLKQSIHHAHFELVSIMKSNIQVTVHRSPRKELLQERLLVLYMTLFLFPRSTTTFANDDPELDLVRLGLFPPLIESYVKDDSRAKVVNIPGEPAAFQALKFAIQDRDFIPNINRKMISVMNKELQRKQRLTEEQSLLFCLLNNNISGSMSVWKRFGPLIEEQEASSESLEWTKHVQFSPEMLLFEEESGISCAQYWQNVENMVLQEEVKQVFSPGDRDLPGENDNLSKVKLYHSSLGPLSVDQFIYRPSDEVGFWFTQVRDQIFGVVFRLGDSTNVDKDGHVRPHSEVEERVSSVEFFPQNLTNLGGLLVLDINKAAVEKLPQC